MVSGEAGPCERAWLGKVIRQMSLLTFKHYLFDWGNTLMLNDPEAIGPMHAWPSVEAMHNAVLVLKVLSESAQCHVATNAKDSTADDIKLALNRVGLGGYITEIFCFREIGAEKPSQLFFDHVLTTLGCNKSEILMVGDDLEKDVLGAIDSGISSVLYNPDSRPIPTGILAITDLNQLSNANDGLTYDR